MKSQRLSTIVSVLALTVVFASSGSARAQWGYSVNAGDPSVSPFGHEYATGNGWGATAYDYGSFGGSSYVGYGTTSSDYSSSGGFSHGGDFGIDPFANVSDILSTGQTLTSHEPPSDLVLSGPGRSGLPRRIYHRNQVRRNVHRTVVKR